MLELIKNIIEGIIFVILYALRIFLIAGALIAIAKVGYWLSTKMPSFI